MSTGVIFSRKYKKKKPLLKLPSVDQKGREHAKYDLRQKKKEKKRTEREKKEQFCLPTAGFRP